MRALALMGVLWAGAMLLLGVAGVLVRRDARVRPDGGRRDRFAFGECLHGTSTGARRLTSAPPDLVGRYMALQPFVAGRLDRRPGRRRVHPAARAVPPLAARRRAEPRRRGRSARTRAASAARASPRADRRRPGAGAVELSGGKRGTMANMPVMPATDDPSVPMPSLPRIRRARARPRRAAGGRRRPPR